MVHIMLSSIHIYLYLGIKGYIEGKPIPTESALKIRKLESDGIKGDFIWVQIDMHFCSFVGNLCITLSNCTTIIKGEAIVTLTPYNKTDPSQMWVTQTINKGEWNEKQLIRHHVEANICLTFEEQRLKEIKIGKAEFDLPIGANLCGRRESRDWTVSLLPVRDKPENRQRFLKIKNSNSNNVNQ